MIRDEPIDRYRRVGLSGNPFAAPESNAQSDPVFVPVGLPDPPAPGSHALIQVIGEQGAGKSTHVQHWRSLQAGPYHYICRQPYWRRWLRPPVQPMTYGDEIDRMPRPLRRWWFARLAQAKATLVIGTHRDLSALGERFGFRVRTHRLGPISREAFARMVNAQLQRCALEPYGRGYQFCAEDLDVIWHKSHGNPRLASGYCHELLAQRLK